MIYHIQVVMANSSQAWELISDDFISLDEIFLLIVDDCHFSTLKSHPLHKVSISSSQPLSNIQITDGYFTVDEISHFQR